ncbi:sulfite exporter TauE/SafE family protein [Algoriphagus halophytocola]|uniref:Probable membrane transporter protein n=1 Tax=Algoriphagus halophytocola TaxID=2991499 RepID=A0ABY6MIG1_9BACT|nr:MULTISPECIES: sulfite exporter TauE/SafE family protein [unclassified Algoriphagus]UZD23254.1 sulfite exporter TauE/SafE family protein [Algoriphagus sp. TR-M5]WBL44548.1 sulfite exporter TauE/SafE family protein [Algoriphagus sp. TR-M9]
MDVIVLVGYAAAVIIGVSLGLIGGGGSILTVPVLVYILGIDPVLATAYSLFVVGSTSLVGSFTYMKKELVDYKTALVFAIPSFIAVFLTRKFLVPAIPEHMFDLGSLEVTKNIGIMVFFAIIMFAASVSMIQGNGKKDVKEDSKVKFNIPLIAIEGLVVGTITGIVGAGGGFLIIPALVLLAKLPMKKAVGTSLLIIAAKSLIGFLGDVSNQVIDWKMLLIFTGLSIVGIFIGSSLSKKINEKVLKKGFGWFVLVMALYIISKELF